MMRDEGSMDRVWTWVQFAGVMLIAWWAGLHSAYRVLLVMQAVDVVSGVLAAGATGTLRSRIGHVGIRRKGAAWLLIMALAYIQGEAAGYMALPETGGVGVAQWTAAGLAFMEFVSIVENVARMGVPLPGWLRKSLRETTGRFGYGADDQAGGK